MAAFSTVRTPSAAEIIELAADFGIRLDADLAQSYRDLIDEGMESYRRIDQLVEPKLPVRYARTPGYRPDRQEDPLNAWWWKSEIKGAASGPLAGKTVALKDNVCLAGVPMTIGTSLLESYVPDIDATLVTRILDAGATILGKAVCGAFCLEGSSITASTGLIPNPHNLAHAAGGSSSGSGALVAAGEVDLAVGADQGGSLRIPSSWCGLHGLKPTYGLVPYSGLSSLEFTLDHAGPMARDIEDMALLLQAMAGPDGYDSRQHGSRVGDYVGALNQGAKGLKIAVLKQGFARPGSDAVVDKKVRAALRRFEKLGCTVDEVSLPLHHDAVHIWIAIAREGAAQNMLKNGGAGANQQGYQITPLVDASARALRQRPDDMADTAKLTLLFSEYMQRNYHGRYYAKGQNLRHTLRAAYDSILADYDLIALPTVCTLPPRLPDPDKCSPEQYEHDAHDSLLNPSAFNATGPPAGNLPCGVAPGNLPVGLSLVARHFDDATIIRASAAFSEKFNWTNI
ncbi:MAG: amidase [Rhodospirillaceae bacterium]|nr:amidase [Rhodospirillaceae bacterium]